VQRQPPPAHAAASSHQEQQLLWCRPSVAYGGAVNKHTCVTAHREGGAESSGWPRTALPTTPHSAASQAANCVWLPRAMLRRHRETSARDRLVRRAARGGSARWRRRRRPRRPRRTGAALNPGG
jgi:hypothetical protein